MTDRAGYRQYFSITRKVGEIPALDGLRGIAILLVLLRHAAHPLYQQYGELLRIGDWDIAVPMLNGWMGVDLFFVLSGFLITHHLIRRWPGQFDRRFLGRYWSKRVLRTFPAFYAAVLIAAFGLVPLYQPVGNDLLYSLRIHFLFLQDYVGSDLVPAFWSLGVEEKFYLLAPFVLLLIRKRPLALQLPVLILAALLPMMLRVATVLSRENGFSSYSDFFWSARSPFHLAMDGLWIGVICALLYHYPGMRERVSGRLANTLFFISLTMLAALVFSVAWFEQAPPLVCVVVLNIVALAFGVLLFAVLMRSRAACKPLQSAWLRGLSTISYSVYLMHMMFIPAALFITRQIIGTSDWSTIVTFMLFLPVFGTLSLAGGYLLHLAIEKPFLIIKDRIRA